MKINDNVKELEIAGIKLKNNFFMAPLAGITNLPYRKLVSKFNPGLIYTEMISANALVRNSKETFSMLEETKYDDYPLALQLFSGDIDSMVESVKICEKVANYSFLDINLGCSVPKVLKQNAGSSFVDRPKDLLEYLTAICKVSTKPVIVKTRIGPTDSNITILDNLKIFEKVGVEMVAIHGRSRKALYNGSTNYDAIKLACESTYLPVIANGNISETNFLEVLNYTKAAGIMIGRNAVGFPSIFDILNKISKMEQYSYPTLGEQLLYLKELVLLMKTYSSDFESPTILRGIAPQFFKGFKNSKEIRVKFVTCRTLDDFLSYIEELLQTVNLEERRLMTL